MKNLRWAQLSSMRHKLTTQGASSELSMTLLGYLLGATLSKLFDGQKVVLFMLHTIFKGKSTGPIRFDFNGFCQSETSFFNPKYIFYSDDGKGRKNRFLLRPELFSRRPYPVQSMFYYF